MEISLNGSWFYQVDPLDQGLKQEWFKSEIFKKNINLSKVILPKCWNTIEEDGEFKYDRYEGIMWFIREFEIEGLDEKFDYYLQFNGANYISKVWLNEKYLGMNEGGFLPFKFKINDFIKDGINNIVVRVDNTRRDDGIPAKGTDWYNWGGIYRDIFIDILPKTRIANVKIKTTEIGKNYAIIELFFRLTKPFNFNWEILYNNDKVLKGEIKEGSIKFRIKLKITNPKLWNPEYPHLYILKIVDVKRDYRKSIKFGIRLIEIKNGILYLNKKIADLKGVCLHEELVPYARAIPIEERRNDIINMKKMGFNALRTAHYSHDESLIDLADELGIYILEELPIYWVIQFKNTKILKLAVKMINTLIERDYNHPSVIMWSLGNEIPVDDKYCQHVLRHLYLFAKKKDDSRIITHVTKNYWGDPLRKYSDVVCLNEYLGWYYFSERNLNFILELIRSTAPEKPWFITEFGAGAKFGFHSNIFEKFSEEKQASIISHSIETFNSKKFIQGHFIWIYRDFRSPLRQNKYQKGFNRKGIVSEKNEQKFIARIYSKIKDKKSKRRKFTFFSFLTKFPFYYLEQFAYDSFLNRVLNLFIVKKIDKYYQKLN